MPDELQEAFDSLPRQPMAPVSDRRQALRKHLVLALAIGGAMFGISLWSAVEVARTERNLRPQQRDTFTLLVWSERAIEEYQQEHGKLPGSLAELSHEKGYRPRMKQGMVGATDAWNHPFQYELTGTEYRLRSLGKDGLAGGTGLNADIDSTDEWASPELKPTVSEALFELMPSGMWHACLFSGALAFGLYLHFQSDDLRSFEPRSGRFVLKAVVSVVVTSMIVVIVGWILVLLHVPNGH